MNESFEMANAVEQLVLAATAEKEIIEILSETNNKLTEQIQHLIRQLETAMATIKEVAGAKPEKENNQPETLGKGKKKNWNPSGYCWSHGFKVTFGHCSETCK